VENPENWIFLQVRGDASIQITKHRGGGGEKLKMAGFCQKQSHFFSPVTFDHVFSEPGVCSVIARLAERGTGKIGQIFFWKSGRKAG